MDLVLSMTREILDLTFIIKTYTRKWNAKFRIKELIRKSMIESMIFTFQETQLIWYMSPSRFVAFKAVDFKTKPV